MAGAKRIQILLSTYNGAKYLREQLDSFVDLTGDFQLSVLIRDDGSTDNTVSVLRQYAQQYGFIVIEGENIGVNKSIWQLLEQSDGKCDYYAISDQDDIWLPDKMSKYLKVLAGCEPAKPILCGSISKIVDEELVPLGNTLKLRRPPDYFNAMLQNVLPGHTQVFNRALVDSVLQHGVGEIYAIDWWLYLVATALGEVVYLPEYTVLHRQHSDNAVGYRLAFGSKLLKRLQDIDNAKGGRVSIQLADFYYRYKDDMSEMYSRETWRYINGLTSFFKRLGYAVSCKAYRQSALETMLFRVLYLAGAYNCYFDEDKL